MDPPGTHAEYLTAARSVAAGEDTPYMAAYPYVAPAVSSVHHADILERSDSMP